MNLDNHYHEKVYAGVLGKIIGVYLGRPFEQWSHELIIETFGHIEFYINNKVGKPLIVPDDDITGTFSFIRSLSDYGNKFDVSPKEIGQTWLNNIVEGETILWWGGVGHSTENTAFQNLKKGITAPASGSKNTNGKGISEQIGAQIFIDGWAMVCPGDPERAVDLAKRAASVSHDGEAIYGAQIIAAIESLAFIENNIEKLLEKSIKLIPSSSLIYKLINEIQYWSSSEVDWKNTLKKIRLKYGYDKFPGACHIIPNHALIIMALLYGKGDFQKSMMIINTSGWDTDCNAGNLGCILGIMNGLNCFKKGPDWRSPISDIMYCPTAIGGETITDAVRETFKIINITRGFRGLEPLKPKNGARYHFEMPGSVQGWKYLKKEKNSISSIKNVNGNSFLGKRSLEVNYEINEKNKSCEVFVDTFFPEEIKNYTGLKKEVFFSYNFICCPIIYPNQEIKARIKAYHHKDKNLSCSLFVKAYGKNDELLKFNSPKKILSSNDSIELKWKVSIEDGHPISQIGLEFDADTIIKGKVYIDYVSIIGNPKTTFLRPYHVPKFERGVIYNPDRAEMWRNSWVQATKHWTYRDIKGADFKIGNDDGRGMLLTGTTEWKNYQIRSCITFDLVRSGGIAVRVQGLQRYYSLELTNYNTARLIKMLDGLKVLCEIDFKVEFDKEYTFSLSVEDNRINGKIDDIELNYIDEADPLLFGGIGLVVEDGTLFTNKIHLNN